MVCSIFTTFKKNKSEFVCIALSFPFILQRSFYASDTFPNATYRSQIILERKQMAGFHYNISTGRKESLTEFPVLDYIQDIHMNLDNLISGLRICFLFCDFQKRFGNVLVLVFSFGLCFAQRRGVVF